MPTVVTTYLRSALKQYAEEGSGQMVAFNLLPTDGLLLDLDSLLLRRRAGFGVLRRVQRPICVIQAHVI